MDLYNSPSNIFVAGFIGSPKMNFIESKVLSKNDNKTEVDIFGSTKLIVPKSAENTSAGNTVQLGIRPEHLIINEDAEIDSYKNYNEITGSVGTNIIDEFALSLFLASSTEL